MGRETRHGRGREKVPFPLLNLPHSLSPAPLAAKNQSFSADIFVALYMVLFAVLLFTYELMFWKSVDSIVRPLRKNFGFLFGVKGKVSIFGSKKVWRTSRIVFHPIVFAFSLPLLRPSSSSLSRS